jgi:hypothetical protein
MQFVLAMIWLKIYSLGIKQQSLIHSYLIIVMIFIFSSTSEDKTSNSTAEEREYADGDQMWCSRTHLATG